jgi:hypothetical protein
MLLMWDGGGPNVVQRAQLLSALEHRPFRTAIVTPSAGVVASVDPLRIFNPELRCFGLEEISDALRHAGVASRRYREVAALLQHLISEVPRARVSRRVLAHVEERLASDGSTCMDSGVVNTRKPQNTRKRLLSQWLRGA